MATNSKKAKQARVPSPIPAGQEAGQAFLSPSPTKSWSATVLGGINPIASQQAPNDLHRMEQEMNQLKAMMSQLLAISQPAPAHEQKV
ncbi:MAG TPA: hypothetical protein VN922_00790, partial [Bacteroidia bacterium]|nr:hypothetical protein [Bacteroidia bacterium]